MSKSRSRDPGRVDEALDRGGERAGVAALALDVGAVGPAEGRLHVATGGDEGFHVG
jgi:hypothetical protein